MKFIKGTDKNQYSMLPPVLDDWIPEGHPVRVVCEFVDSMDIEWNGSVDKRTGRPSYPPEVMLKILLYGYMTGERSSRILERKTYDDLGFRWLSEDLHPDYRTIARFRQYNGIAIKDLLKETLVLYREAGYEIKGIVFTDGTKVSANASDHNVASDERIKQLEEQAAKILAEAEQADKEEDDDQGDDNNKFIKRDRLEKVRARIAEYKAKQKEVGKKTASMVDGDANFMKHSGNKGIHLSYNAQITADSNGMIVSADVSNRSIDGGELLEENLKQTEKNLEKKIDTIVADAGYYETEAIRKLSNSGYKCLVPKRGKANNDSKFVYDSERDVFVCERGEPLKKATTKVSRKNRYDIYAAKIGTCLSCKLCGKCYTGTGKGKYGRQLGVYENHGFVLKHIEQLEANRSLYNKRQGVVEPIIGTIKVRHRFRGFLLRGLEIVKIEWNLVATGFNLMKLWKLKVKMA